MMALLKHRPTYSKDSAKTWAVKCVCGGLNGIRVESKELARIAYQTDKIYSK
jgi:hypothetical protein